MGNVKMKDIGHPATGQYLEPDTSSPDYLTGDGTVTEEVTSLEDYFAKKKSKYERAIINGKAFHFQSGSPKAKDALLAKHSKDDGQGNVTVDQTMWRTDAIALTWVTGPGGARILDSSEKAHRFHAEADADEELEMYKVAARMLGLKEPGAKEAERKNSDNGGGTVDSRTSPSDSSALYPGNSLLS
jgi:hypothetical protein